ncbi:MAG: hypothetical protein ACE14P_11325 [Methanotrichaceae archaeon]
MFGVETSSLSSLDIKMPMIANTAPAIRFITWAGILLVVHVPTGMVNPSAICPKI